MSGFHIYDDNQPTLLLLGKITNNGKGRPMMGVCEGPLFLRHVSNWTELDGVMDKSKQARKYPSHDETFQTNQMVDTRLALT